MKDGAASCLRASSSRCSRWPIAAFRAARMVGQLGRGFRQSAVPALGLSARWPAMAMAMAMPISGTAAPIRWPRSPTTSAMPAGGPDEPWGVRASVPVGFDRSRLTNRLDAPSCPRVHARHSVWKTVREWRALGVQPLRSIADDDTWQRCLNPTGAGNGSFLLTGNYRVILHYNCSNYYALSVGLLADEIAR